MTFNSFNAQQATLEAAGIRIDDGKTLAQGLEPEYIAVAPDGSQAVITLQENNGFAILNLTTNTITSIVPLGTKDHGLTANAADFSDRDTPGSSNVGIIDIQPAPGVKGLYMPDAIASFTSGGQTYYVTANEGDAYDGFGQTSREDAIRVGSATLDPALVASIVGASATDEYATEADIKNNDNLGRLNVSKFGDTDGDGDLDQLQAYGGRSFSIWDSAGTLVFDSGNVIERATALLTPTLFNANDGLASAFDTRSDDKAAEPEGVTIGTVGGRTYAFVALERAGGGVMAFDVTDPANVTFSQYARNAADISAEGVLFIDSASSPNGKNIVAVSNEVSGSVSLYQVDKPFTLQILHYYGESGLLGVDTAPIMGAMIDKFDNEYANTLVLGEGDSFIPGPWLVAGADPSLNAVPGIGSTALGRPDIAIMNAFGTDASALGNHEYDLGSPVLQGAIQNSGAWVGAQFPLVTSNLDFSADSSLRGLADKTLGGTSTNDFAGDEASTIKGKITPYTIVTQGTEKIGIVGSTTFELLSKSSPNGTVPKDDGNPATSDLQEVAAYLQATIDALKAQGINKIVMVDQLDTLERNKELAGMVSGIDIMVAGGGHELMKDSTDTLGSYPGHIDPAADAYPIVTAGADGAPVLIVTTDTEYSYLGRLVVEFNGDGVLDTSKLDININGAYSSDEATLQDVYNTTDSADAIIDTSVIGSKVEAIVDAIDAVVDAKDGNIFGYTNVYLEGDRVFGRTQEVNFGNISADANREAADDALGGTQPFIVSLKNGGGIRASIGSVDADGNKIPPIASGVKSAGAISQLDIENALRFDNKLMMFDTTAQGLLNIFNFAAGLSSSPSQQSGGYPQIGGVKVSYDPDNAAGSKVQSISLVDDQGNVIAKVVENGVVSASAPALISVVTLNFTANGGDGYPIKANGDNFRYLLADGTLSTAVNKALDFTATATFTSVGQTTASILGEQKAFQDFLLEHHPTPETAYDVADTPASGDERIQNLNFRSDTVLDGIIAGDANANTLTGTAEGETIVGLGGDDIIIGGAGDDLIDGGDGSDEVLFISSDAGVSVNLAAGEAKTIRGITDGEITNAASMLDGENGFTVTPLFTVGETIEGTTGALNASTAGNFTPTGVLDGIGAYELDANTVRVFVNSELANNRGQAYTLENGTSLTGSRVQYFDIDKTTKAIKDAGVAYDKVYVSDGSVLDSTSDLVEGRVGFDRFCSGSLYEPEQFGAGNGLVDRIYFAPEETGGAFSNVGGSMWALDVATGEFWQVPAMGHGGWENVAEVDTGRTTHVAFILQDDTSPYDADGDASLEAAPMYLYVGEKSTDANANFLEKNGLAGGKLYVWKADNAAVTNPSTYNSTTNAGPQAGTWVEIDNTPTGTPSENGTTGFDEFGYPTQDTLFQRAEAVGAFQFSRPEDVSTNPDNGAEFVFASTGVATAFGGADAVGTVYKTVLDFTDINAPKATLDILYDGNADPDRPLRSPDNLAWADDDLVYVQEDRANNALFNPATVNPNDASIVRIDPTTGVITRVAEIDRGGVPFGQTDGSPSDFGNWESSGILDVSTLFGEAPGSLFLADVQAHSIALGNTAQVEGGQLSLIAAPGVKASLNIELDTIKNVENVTGSNFDDTIIGYANANILSGSLGNDRLDGGAGNDNLNGMAAMTPSTAAQASTQFTARPVMTRSVVATATT